ncbi:YfiR family protein [Noviherbaspirillum denitrificans]|uniref:DUF4154 domain-containing protein n=1 Tax=Noviherbaspirillum denitrificans TaxID=1968433 RepID=A0A254T8Y9_9BURK|nr:YfiR family protein [Noviherbaspirillum denitrificans]OWW19121.1 hypothetical protein AYR66_06055 [Noviherbaspirillum denitrificans]
MFHLFIFLLRSIARRLLPAAFLLPAAVAAEPVPEYALKAAFVYNFALFTEWPSDTAYEGGTLNICVNPGSVLRQSLAGLGERAVKGRRIAVRNLAALDALNTCHVLFVDGGDRERWVQIKKGLGGAAVLTISDDEEIGHDGSIIALSMDNKRVVFDVDTRAARQARLAISSKLLRLARMVQ